MINFDRDKLAASLAVFALFWVILGAVWPSSAWLAVVCLAAAAAVSLMED